MILEHQTKSLSYLYLILLEIYISKPCIDIEIEALSASILLICSYQWAVTWTETVLKNFWNVSYIIADNESMELFWSSYTVGTFH